MNERYRQTDDRRQTDIHCQTDVNVSSRSLKKLSYIMANRIAGTSAVVRKWWYSIVDLSLIHI